VLHWLIGVYDRATREMTDWSDGHCELVECFAVGGGLGDDGDQAGGGAVEDLAHLGSTESREAPALDGLIRVSMPHFGPLRALPLSFLSVGLSLTGHYRHARERPAAEASAST
jgi:hypothetical protein